MNTKVRFTDTKKSQEICSELESRFLDGEILTKAQIINEYISVPETMLGMMQSKSQVTNWFNTLRRRFTNIHERWFGAVNELGQYGLFAKEEEMIFVLTRYYNRQKGMQARARQVYTEAKMAKLGGMVEEKLIAVRVVGGEE